MIFIEINQLKKQVMFQKIILGQNTSYKETSL